MRTEAAQKLLAELEENPLAGARYARDVVDRRIDAVEVEGARPYREQLDTMTKLARELLRIAEQHPDELVQVGARLMASLPPGQPAQNDPRVIESLRHLMPALFRKDEPPLPDPSEAP